MLITPNSAPDLELNVIDEDSHVRISFNTENRFVKMDLLPDFNDMNLEGLWDTLAILSDVIQEQEIDTLLIDCLALESSIVDNLGGLEFYASILKYNIRLRKLAILTIDSSAQHTQTRLSQSSSSTSTVQVFSREPDALAWTTRPTPALAS